MDRFEDSRRRFLKAASFSAGAFLLSAKESSAKTGRQMNPGDSADVQAESGKADYTLRIAATPIEIAPKRIVSATTYNDQFPGPLLRFKEGKPVPSMFSTTPTLRNNCIGTG